MFVTNPVCGLFNISYPIIQAGMIWCSGWKLATAVSNAGGLGLIGAGSMTPDVLEEHILKATKNTNRPFGVNLPMLGQDLESKIEVIRKQKVRIIFTSAGNPRIWTSKLKSFGCTVAHVVSSSVMAQKAVDAGVDAVVAEGFEAGGHNGREETTTFVLIPAVRKITEKPLIAAGGMYGGNSLLAAMALGADGIQVGSRFAVSLESSAHDHFKSKVFEINEGDTRLILRKLVPVRMIRNRLFEELSEAEERGAGRKELMSILGEGKSRRGIFEGDLENGELEIGQISSLLTRVQTASEIIEEIVNEYRSGINTLLLNNE